MRKIIFINYLSRKINKQALNSTTSESVYQKRKGCTCKNSIELMKLRIFIKFINPWLPRTTTVEERRKAGFYTFDVYFVVTYLFDSIPGIMLVICITLMRTQTHLIYLPNHKMMRMKMGRFSRFHFINYTKPMSISYLFHQNIVVWIRVWFFFFFF